MMNPAPRAARTLLALCLLLIAAAPVLADPAAPVVRVVLYWSEGCGHCPEVLDGVLPELQRQYGEQLEVRLVEVLSLEDITAFFDVAEGYGYARGKAAVPFLLVGDRALMGVEQIRRELPGIIAQRLAAGGADWPALTPASAGAAALPDDACSFFAPCPTPTPAAPQPTAARPPIWLVAALGLTVAAGAGLVGAMRSRKK